MSPSFGFCLIGSPSGCCRLQRSVILRLAMKEPLHPSSIPSTSRGKRDLLITLWSHRGWKAEIVRRTSYSLEEPPPPRSTQARPLTNSRSLLTCHGGWACCCASVSSSSPGENHGDSADTEMSRPAAEALCFTGVLLSNNISKGWFNSACSLHKTNKSALLPFGEDEYPTVTLSLDPIQRT